MICTHFFNYFLKYSGLIYLFTTTISNTTDTILNSDKLTNFFYFLHNLRNNDAILYTKFFYISLICLLSGIYFFSFLLKVLMHQLYVYLEESFIHDQFLRIFGDFVYQVLKLLPRPRHRTSNLFVKIYYSTVILLHLL